MTVLLNSSINLFSGGNILTWVLLAIIIVLQLYFAINTWQTQNKLKDIFSSKSDAYKLVKENDFNKIISTHKNKILDEILQSLNYYLEKNKGAANDYHLIKDIVDRHCDTYEEEISAQVPIPLFIGLAGTMIGILIGVLFLVFYGNLEALLNVSETVKSDPNAQNGMTGIIELLGGVGLAMISSFFGIVLAVITSSRSVNSNNTLEKNKNIFYSWIQAELLPVLSQSANSAFHLLSSNLRLFNDTFSENTANLDNTLQLINQSYKDQAGLIESIDKLKIKEIATANIRVYRELQASTDKISQFNEYLQMITSYVNRVGELNENINNHLDRTKAIEDMGVFFKEEITQIADRKRSLSLTVAEIDKTLSNSFEELKNNSQASINEYKNLTSNNNLELQKNSDQGVDILNCSIKSQYELYEKSLNKHIQLHDNVINQQLEIYKSKMDEIENKKGHLSITVAKIDDALSESMKDLENHSIKQLEQYKNTLLINNEKFAQSSSDSLEILEKSLGEQKRVHKEVFDNQLKMGENILKTQLTLSENTIIEQQNIFKEKIDEISSLVEELKDESSINRKLSQLVDIAIKQEQSIKAMGGKIDNIDYSPQDNSGKKQPLPQWVKVSAISTASLVSLTSLAILIPILIEWINKLIN